MFPASAYCYGIAVIDDHGRIAEKALLRELGWKAGHRVDVSASDGVIVIQTHAHSPLSLTQKGLV